MGLLYGLGGLGCFWQFVFVLGFVVGVDDYLCSFFVQWLVVQEGVDFGIGDVVGSFVWMVGVQVFEVGGGDFFYQVFWSVEGVGEGVYLMFGQVVEWSQVVGVVVEFGEEFYDCFGGMVGVDYQVVVGVGDGVLGDYVDVCFDIVDDEVVFCWFEFFQGFQLFCQGFY